MDTQITFRSEQRLTQDEFFHWLGRLPDDDLHHYELIHGRIVMTPPAGFLHGTIEALLVQRLGNHVEQLELGTVLASSAGYDLPSGDTLEPDVSFVSKERLAAAPPFSRERFGRVVPDLVIEILSPSTTRRDRTEKKDIYAANGVCEYWLVDPTQRQVTVFALHDGNYGEGVVCAAGAVPSEVLRGLELSIEQIFRQRVAEVGEC